MMMAMKAAIVDAEDEVAVDSAVAKEEWTVRKRRMAIEAIQADMVSVAVTPNNARTMEASIPAAAFGVPSQFSRLPLVGFRRRRGP